MFSRVCQHVVVGLSQRPAKIAQDFVLALAGELFEPLQSLQNKALDGADGQCASALSRSMAPHAVGHNEQVSAVAALLQICLRQTGAVYLQRLDHRANQKLVLVMVANLAYVRETETTNVERSLPRTVCR